MATVATTTAEKTTQPLKKKPIVDEKPERKSQRARVDDRFKVFCWNLPNERSAMRFCQLSWPRRGDRLWSRASRMAKRMSRSRKMFAEQTCS